MEKRIKELPSSCSDAPQLTLLNVCHDFLDRIRKHTEGDQGHEGFIQTITEDFELLKEKLLATHPKFVLSEQIEREVLAETSPESHQDSRETVNANSDQGILIRLQSLS